MSERKAFVQDALAGEVNKSELCRSYGISRKTGYKWLERYQQEGRAGLSERSRRPQHSPKQTPPEVEQVVVEARERHPTWGGRKLKRWLENRGYGAIPTPSTITEILRRHGLLDLEEGVKHKAWTRFEMEQPNDLWQMDFKGYFGLEDGTECHPLTVLDDHSRFLLGLAACANEQAATVQPHLTTLFRRYGLPKRMLMDNGPPWGSTSGKPPYTALTVWLLRLGIRTSHGRPFHPQTQGKDERLHRTLKLELLKRRRFATLPACQPAFDNWRSLYNQQRPHEALDLDPPAAHYRASSRPFPERLPPLTFPDGAIIRRVNVSGAVSFRGRQRYVGYAFRKYKVGLLYDDFDDTQLHVYFNCIRVHTIDLSV